MAKGDDLVLLEIDLDGATDEGLALAEKIRDLGKGLRIAGLVSGRAPGSGLAVLLSCRDVLATEESRLGPIPDRGAIREAVADLLRARGVRDDVLRRLFPSAGEEGGMTAGAALRAGLIDHQVEGRAAALVRLGVEPESAEVPVEPSREGRRTVTGEFKKPFLLPFEGEIDDISTQSVKRRVEQAKAAGADLILFEVDSPGGYVSSSMETGDYIFSLDIPTVMLIFKSAYSGAALVSLAGEEIIMSEGGVIGDCQPISIGAGGYTVLGEKLQSPLRAVFRKYAKRNGYSTLLAESMVTQEMQVDRATFADGTVLYVTPEEVADLEAVHGKATVEVVVPANKLLTMHGDEARDLGFTGRLVKDRAEALSRWGLTESDLTILEESWAEGTSRFLMGIKFLLFLVGIVSLWMELKTPGLGVPGAVAVIAFTLFFGASAVAGITSGLEVVLFLLGVALLALELLVIPGFGVPGIAGALLILVSLYMASVKYGLPSRDAPWQMDEFTNWLLYLVSTLVASVFGIWILAKIFPGTSFGKKMILAPAGPAGSLGLTGSGSVSGDRAKALVGARGKAETDLRPAGRIVVEGEPWDAVTEGDWITRGTDVEIVAVSGNRIVVKEA
jgi:membrane-bound serine protease (ClpP class)